MAGHAPIPAEVRAFLRDHIPSYDQLAVLLLLHHRADAIWTTHTIATELRTSPEVVHDALARLRATGLIEAMPAGTFRFPPGPSAIATLVDQLAQLHDRDRLGVMNLMNSNAIERVRNRALHTFADAFVLRRKKPDDG